MANGKLKKVNFSALTSDVISEVLRGNIFELVRNKRPYGVFLVRKPRTEAEVEELAELLRETIKPS